MKFDGPARRHFTNYNSKNHAKMQMQINSIATLSLRNCGPYQHGSIDMISE